MAELDEQIRRYVSALDDGPPIDPDEILRAATPTARRSGGHRPFLVAAAVLVVVVIGAALVAIDRRDSGEDPAPRVDTTAGPTVIPTSWSRIGEIDGAQPFAMAASGRGVVLVGYGAWWSADGTSWETASIDGLEGPNPTFPGSVSDVVATDDGFLAVGTGGDKQPAVWRSETGRSWERVVDPDLELPTGAIPDTVSTPYGAIVALAATDDGFVAVGSVFGGTLGRDGFRPAIWESPDGIDWHRVTDLPPGPGNLSAVTRTTKGVLALGSQGGRGVVWERTGDAWEPLGGLDAGASQLAEVDGRLVAAGATTTPDARAVPTIWTSEDGRTWTVAHTEPAAAIASITALVPDGEALLALGYSGPAELEAGPLALASTDGTTWSALPAVDSPGLECTPAADGQQACVGTSGHPFAAAVVDGRLLFAAQEAVTGPGERSASVTRLRTAIYRSDVAPTEEPVDGVLSAELELPATLAAGENVEGTLVVRNGTGQAITAIGCGRPFGVELGNDTVDQTLGRLACRQEFTLPTGESAWPVTVVGSYGSCVVGEPSAGVESCQPDGTAPPLPAGTYTATALVPAGVPAPEPVIVEVR